MFWPRGVVDARRNVIVPFAERPSRRALMRWLVHVVFDRLAPVRESFSRREWAVEVAATRRKAESATRLQLGKNRCAMIPLPHARSAK